MNDAVAEVATVARVVENARAMKWYDWVTAACLFGFGFMAAYYGAHASVQDAIATGLATLAAHQVGLHTMAPGDRIKFSGVRDPLREQL